MNWYIGSRRDGEAVGLHTTSQHNCFQSFQVGEQSQTHKPEYLVVAGSTCTDFSVSALLL